MSQSFLSDKNSSLVCQLSDKVRSFELHKMLPYHNNIQCMLNFVKLQPWGGVAISTSHLTLVNTVIYRPSDRMTTLTGMLTDTCMHIHMTQTHTNANTHTVHTYALAQCSQVSRRQRQHSQILKTFNCPQTFQVVRPSSVCNGDSRLCEKFLKSASAVLASLRQRHRHTERFKSVFQKCSGPSCCSVPLFNYNDLVHSQGYKSLGKTLQCKFTADSPYYHSLSQRLVNS